MHIVIEHYSEYKVLDYCQTVLVLHGWFPAPLLQFSSFENHCKKCEFRKERRDEKNCFRKTLISRLVEL